MTLKEKSAVEVLKSAHKRILDLLDKSNETLNAKDKEKLLADISLELSVLSVLETEVFYPAITEADADFDLTDFVESHDKIKISMAQAQRLMGEEPDFDPQMKELSNLVREHIEREDKNLFTNLQDSSMDVEAIADAMNEKCKEFHSHSSKNTDLGFTI